MVLIIILSLWSLFIDCKNVFWSYLSMGCKYLFFFNYFGFQCPLWPEWNFSIRRKFDFNKFRSINCFSWCIILFYLKKPVFTCKIMNILHFSSGNNSFQVILFVYSIDQNYFISIKNYLLKRSFSSLNCNDTLVVIQAIHVPV